MREEGRVSATVLLRAAHFAAERHRGQTRKNIDAYPYINHPIFVAELLTRVGGVTDVDTLAAALLHDTVEDTPTTPEEIEARFGAVVRGLVEEMTDDKRLPKLARKQRQIEEAAGLSRQAKAIKLADKIANVRDVIDQPPPDWPLARRVEYLDWSVRVVAGCRGTNDALERHFDELIARGRAALSVEPASPGRRRRP
ncbi:MAG: bifunctional (p)ppGpp synthetase/guanosine-3',5'-bis(diphosphate) 3'-pyrophosphohydrolase [Acidimicrobiia bacterium]|nr:bifunctional (p)ppGpp synthetase/guanosine-3',5'-bis(diphosphate) 3'-pyrophosphohydrolase [Acidimicrobiia bacterium]